MAVSDRVRNQGVALIEIFDAEGTLREVLKVRNLVVDSGLSWIAQRLTGSPPAMSAMAAGSNGSAVTAGQTALLAETGRVALTSSVSGKTTTYSAIFSAGAATGTVAELGIFNSSGTMLNRVVFTPQQKGSGDSFKVTWTVQQST